MLIKNIHVLQRKKTGNYGKFEIKIDDPTKYYLSKTNTIKLYRNFQSPYLQSDINKGYRRTPDYQTHPII